MKKTIPDVDFNELRELAIKFSVTAKQTVNHFSPIVEQIIESSSQHEQYIEHTLDSMLRYCLLQEMFDLYKKLCSYYYTINPVATAGYVDAYRDMWDSDEENVVD